MRACPKCGEIYDSTLAACPKCGTPVGESTAPGVKPPQAGAPFKLTPGIIAVFILVDLIFFGIVAWMLFKK